MNIYCFFDCLNTYQINQNPKKDQNEDHSQDQYRSKSKKQKICIQSSQDLNPSPPCNQSIEMKRKKQIHSDKDLYDLLHDPKIREKYFLSID